jgi:hypothetical protein
MPVDLPKLKMTFLEVVEALSKPNMYTENGTFGEVWAYLDGYAKDVGWLNYHFIFFSFSRMA